MFSREGRIRLFLAVLILVLVLTNSQSLQVSYHARLRLAESFETQSRELALRIASEIERESDLPPRAMTSRLGGMAEARGLGSACMLDWNGRLVTGGECPAPEGDAFDRLDESGRAELVRSGWAMTDVSPRYDIDRARAFGYLVVIGDGDPSRPGRVLRIEFPAPRLAETDRQFRTTLVYQISALSLVLLAIVLFLNSMLAPHRRLVAEARSVASELSEPGPEDQDEGEFLLTTFQDVVARLKDKELELQALHQLEKARADETEALASDIIRSMTTGLVSLDPSGAVALVNPAAEKIFGIDQDQARGRAFAEVFPGSTELSELATEALSRGAYHLRGQVLYEKADSQLLHLGVSVIPLVSGVGHDPNGSKGALCLLADLTEVVVLRERLFLKENLARLGEMVAGIAHEFRNGLATIMGNAKLLQGHTDPDSSEVVDALLEESLSLSRVVTEFLQFARPEPLHVESVDLGQLLSELKQDLGSRADAAGVTLSLDTQSVNLEGDELLLRKAVSNLIVNAIESLSGSGSETRDPEVRVELEASDGLATIRVRDNGPGVPPEQRDRIFTPFYTGKPDGTGLGLSVVQKIVVSHNGTVELDDSAGGASFVVRLPLNAEAREVSEEWV